MRTIAVFILSIIWTVNISGQAVDSLANDKLVIVKMKDGSVIEGEVKLWEVGEFIVLKTAWDPDLTISGRLIKKVTQKSTLNQPAKIKAPYVFKEQGWYSSYKIQYIRGNNGNRAANEYGYGFSASVGKRYSRLASVGIGVGYDKFIRYTGEQLVPVFLEFSSFFLPSNSTSFVNVQAGYSFAWKDQDYLLLEAKGGFMFYPSIGLRLGDGQIKYTLDIGYKFQKANFRYRDEWTPTSVSDQNLTFKRLTLRFGVLI